MFASFPIRKTLFSLIAVICVMPASLRTAGSSPPPAVPAWQGCGPSMQGLSRLRADLALDSALANRANSLASSSLGNGQPPPANELQSLTEDSLDGLGDASEQIEQAANEIGSQLEAMNLPRQQRAWSQGVQRLRTARTNLRYVTRPGSLSGGRIGSLSASGVGPRMLTEAATAAGDYGNAVDGLNQIKIDMQFDHIARSPGIQRGAGDTNPPQNPGPDPWQEWLKRFQSQQARIRNSVNGLNAARALQGNQLQQAQRHIAEMQKAVQDAQNLANQLQQLAALCAQANVSQPNAATPAQAAPVTAPPRAAASKGGSSGVKALTALVGGAGLGYLGYTALKAAEVCVEPDVQSNFSACVSGSCSACHAFLQQIVPYCDCIERKGETATGTCSEFRSDIEAFRRDHCLVPTAATMVPRPAIKR